MKDRRIIGDRRKLSTAFLSMQSIYSGRRETIRREVDKKKYILVDNYSPRLFIILLLLLLLSITDAYLTLSLVKVSNATELNPIMALYLEHGTFTFFLEKFLFTSVAVFIFCVLNNFAVARVSLALAIIFYFGLVFYELNIMSNFFP
ncbi:membrane hypothetical protein [Candidatus Sulfobium mesophilum]|uniref:DUF5658 domain-containing protein n=1 Tax=Candidatus Sulfobium mesophilum TaxID=2016548 RepID=A0A2U3QKP9_9BACT|nr:membrane hypothetical protein [Candidatus Sulfobium mesophilum]